MLHLTRVEVLEDRLNDLLTSNDKIWNPLFLVMIMHCQAGNLYDSYFTVLGADIQVMIIEKDLALIIVYPFITSAESETEQRILIAQLLTDT